MNDIVSRTQEWLETDGLGGFASGTVSGIRTRRYHALLLSARKPPNERMVLVNGFDAWIETPAGVYMVSSQDYAPDVVARDGRVKLKSFTTDPWPTWRYQLEDGTEIEHELVVAHNYPSVVLTWKLLTLSEGVRLYIRPFLSGRDYHSLHRENGILNFDPVAKGDQLVWKTYPSVDAVVSCSNGSYRHDPQWYRNFLYREEQARGLDCFEDLASPGTFAFDLNKMDAVWLLSTEETSSQFEHHHSPSLTRAYGILASERTRRKKFSSPLSKAADDYIVTGTRGKTIVAGYPWFADWGRDTFIALRGLCLAEGRLADATEILVAWAELVSEGMLPNRLPDHGDVPEYNSVDASLWYIIAVHELFEDSKRKSGVVSLKDKRCLQEAVQTILQGYSQGTRYGIRMDEDGLLSAGQQGVQLTWMDAKVGEWVVTPRIGKPVEIQALWLNALKIASGFSTDWHSHFERGLKSFQEKFWNEKRNCLFDVVDVNHRLGEKDATVRANQIFAVGGLPFQIVDSKGAKRIVEAVSEKLLTPLGLRSLASDESEYQPFYRGGVRERDGAYHQGTVWPWLMGPFVEAWVRAHGCTAAAKAQARKQFLAPLVAHLGDAGLNHVSEIADAEAPHTPRGCPFQAWSVGEILRLDRRILADTPPATPVKSSRRLVRDLTTA